MTEDTAPVRDLLEAIGWGRNSLARQMGIGSRSAAELVSGKVQPSPPVRAWLEALAACHRANPVPAPPPDWYLPEDALDRPD